MRSLLAGLLLLALLPVSASAQDTTDPGEAPSYLSVLEAGQGSFVKRGHGRYILRLRSVDRRGLWFTDRPQHEAGEASTGGILKRFFRQGAGAPNAVIRVKDAARNQDTLVVELGLPSYDSRPRTLEVHAKSLLSATQGLERFRRSADSQLPRRFRDATLFIDSMSQTCKIDLSPGPYTRLGRVIVQPDNLRNQFHIFEAPLGVSASISQYGGFTDGCGGTVYGQLYSNNSPSGTDDSDPGTLLGSFTMRYSSPAAVGPGTAPSTDSLQLTPQLLAQDRTVTRYDGLNPHWIYIIGDKSHPWF